MEPFGGLFGDTPIARVLAQFVADPFDTYVVNEIAELTELSPVEVSDAIERLQALGLVREAGQGYVVNTDCNRYAALTLLAYAIVDDEWDTDCMTRTMCDILGMHKVTHGE